MKKTTIAVLLFFVFQSVMFGRGVTDNGGESSPNAERKTVLLTFKEIPTKQEREKLAKKGIVLEGFVSGTTYYATVPVKKKEENITNGLLTGTGNTSVILEEPSYTVKLGPFLKKNEIPEYAVASSGVTKVAVSLFPSADFNKVKAYIKEKKLKNVTLSKLLLIFYCDLPQNLIQDLATQVWVRRIECIPPPEEINNVSGRSMTRANILSYSGISGRDLEGHGINVGVWDGNIERHVDLDSRLHTREFLYSETHGQHVCGTMAGAGVLDPRARGVAPEVDIFTWNFKYGITAQEMLDGVIEDGIVITQNSYGVSAKNYCKSPRAYDVSAAQSDLLVNIFPFLTHVYSAGNDQKLCTGKSMYGSLMQRHKNAIMVAAVDELENMSDFSSWGPADDGRLLPHISTMGVAVYSTVYNNKYEGGMLWSGTSMAAPAISGLTALLYERYGQLYDNAKPLAALIKGALLNTAKEKGPKGPDFQYGFGIAHGEEAISVLEKKQFFIGKVAHKEKQEYSIEVPDETIQLRVMLVWTDQYGTAGDKALINDLDLTLSNGNKTYLPWVLDPKNPEKEAVRGIDNLNNQEQITIDNPDAGTYNIVVKGTKLPEDAREYALVYYFVKKKLKLDYPNGGETFYPEEKIVARWNSEGYSGTTTVQLSTDNGQNFTTIASGLASDVKACIVPMPKNADTDKALVRVIQEGTMDVSDAPFTVVEVPQNLKLKSQECSNSGWNLSWDTVESAAKYEVLKADGNGGFEIIGETTKNTFILPELGLKDNIFTVRTVTKEGVRGERAFGVIADASKKLAVSSTNLPFSEEFSEVPSPYISVNAADSAYFTYSQLVASSANIAQKGHFLVMHGKNKTKHEGEDSFETAKDNIVDAKICNIDATDIKGDLWMRFGVLVNSSEKQAKLRVLVDGEQKENTFKETEIIENTPGKAIKYYNLSDKSGSNFSLNFQSLLPSISDTVRMTLIQIFQDKKDASLLDLKVPKSAASLSDSEDITIRLRNNSGKELDGITVKYSINEKNIVTEEIKRPIDPFQSINYTFAKKANLSKEDKVYNIEAWVELEGDEQPNNDRLKRTVANYGNYFRMPEKVTFFPEKKEIGEEDILFTDDGAKVFNYSNDFTGAVIFEPKTAGSKTKISFSEFSLGAGDKLTIYDGEYETSKVLAVLDEKSKAPMEFISSHYKGKMLLYFESDKKGNAPGWLATVSQTTDDPSGEYDNNVLSLSLIRNKHGNYKKDDLPPIGIVVKNNTSKVIEGIKVQYKVNGGEWSPEENIEKLEGKESLNYDFQKTFDYSEQSKSYLIEARIVTKDAYMDDNILAKTIVNDVYCVATSNSRINKDFVFFTEVEAAGVSNVTSKKEQGSIYPQYFRDVELPAYKDLANNKISITINKGYDTGNIGLWVDWNNDGVFSGEGETYSPVATLENKTSYAFRYSIPKNINEGKYNARLRVKTGGDLNDVCKSDSYSENGEIEDYTIKVFDNYPYPQDLELVSTSLQDGMNLTDVESVSVTVRNIGSKSIEEFKLSYTVDGGEPVEEIVKQTIATGDEYIYTFEQKANLSKLGYHLIKLTGTLEGDTNLGNNILEKKILNEVPSSDGFYALNFDGVDDIVDLGTLNDTYIKSCTYEAWINPRTAGYYGRVGFGRIIEGKGIVVFLVGKAHKFYKENSIVVAVGGGNFNTVGNIINYNSWQHIAVTVDEENKSVAVYVNGEKVEEATSEQTKEITSFKENTTDSLYIGDRLSGKRAFNGMIDEFRIWNRVRTAEEIKANMYAHQKGAKDLLAEFSFDEGYFNSKVFGGEFSGTIKNAITSDGETSIWVEPTELVYGFRFDEQLIDWRINGDSYETEVTEQTDLSSLVAKFQTTWPNTIVKVGSVEQEGGKTVNNFTNSVSNPILYNAKAVVFGKEINQNLKVTIKKEASVACDLLTLELGAPLDYKVEAISSTIKIPATLSDISSVPTTFTISEGATAYVGDKVLKSGDVLDYSKSVVVRVLAANGRTDKYYTISVQKEQKIEWEQVLSTKTYGDEDFELTAVSSLGAEVIYKSSNSEIVKIALNKAEIVGVGTVEITAYQEGNNTVQQAAPVTKTITITKKDLTIVADDKEIEYTDAIPELTMTFDGFVRNDNKAVLDELPTIETDAEKDSAVGTYPITLSGGVDDNYNYILKSGVLTIKDVPIYTVTFTVKHEGAVEAGAKISLENIESITDDKGVAIVKLKAGKYSYSVTKEGREPVSGEIDLVDKDVEIALNLINELPVYTITYLTDANGDIEGKNIQKIKEGKDGVPVTAIPRKGYKFEKWDDGSTSATHLVTNVHADATYKASFTKRSYKLLYDAGEGGTIKGEASQTVSYGDDGAAVEIIVKDGYTFSKWNDGVKDNPRTDKEVANDISVKAEYIKVYTLPYKQTFDNADMPEGWESVDNAGDGCNWEFKAEGSYYSKPKIEGSDPNHAYMDAYKCSRGGKKDADLLSPVFDLRQYSKVSLKFKHYYKRGFSDKETATVSYSIDGGDWVEIVNFGKDTKETETYEKVMSKLAGKKNVRFKWSLKEAFYFWIVDDIEITGSVAAEEYKVIYRAGENGSIENADAEGVLSATIKHGKEGPQVKAVGKPGFKFYKWSDGSIDNPRQDIVTAEIDVTAIFGSDCKPIDVFPYIEDFNARDEKPDCWETPLNEEGNQWSVSRKNAIGTTGNTMYFNASAIGVMAPIQTAELISPTFDFTNEKEVYVMFKMSFFKIKKDAKAIFSYTLDDGQNWTEINSWDKGSSTLDSYRKKINSLAGRKNVRFRWAYNGAFDYGWNIDDFEVRGKMAYFLMYDAGGEYDENDNWISQGYVKGDLLQTVEEGKDGTEVEAIPEEGYRFVSWSDGATENPRKDLAVKSDIAVVANFEKLPPKYNLVYKAGENGQISGKAKQEVEKGKDGEPVEALADKGYMFVKWSDGSTDNPRTDLAVESDIEVTAQFDEIIIEFDLVYKTNGYGKIEGEAIQKVREGKSGTSVKAVADKGYEFVRWSDGSTDNPRTDAEVNDNMEVEAEFVKTNVPKFVLSYRGGLHGTIEGYNPQIVPLRGDGVPVKAVAYEGYEFVRWSDGKRENPRTDKYVVRNSYVTAVFVKIIVREYNLIYVAGAGGSISGERYQNVMTGESGTAVEAIPASGYRFVRWSDGSTDNPRTETNVKKDIYVKAVFRRVVLPFYRAVYKTNGYGKLLGRTYQRIEEGRAGIPVKAIPFRGYKFVKWSDGSIENPRIDSNVKGDIEVVAEFEKALPRYTLIYIAGDNGKLAGETHQSVERGAKGTSVEAIPNEGTEFVKWSDNVTDNPRTDTDVKCSIVVTALFAQKDSKHTLVYKANRYGTILGASSQMIMSGENGQEVEAVAEDNCKFVKWSDGVTDNPRKDLAVKSNIEVTAEFVEIPRDHYSLYYIAGIHGSLIGKIAQTVDAGKDGVAVEALPDTGYKFVKWSDDVTDNPRTDKAVSSDIHVEAIFEEAEAIAEYELVYKTDGNGLIEGISIQIVSEGSDGLKVKAVAYRGYKFSQWSDGVTDNPRKDLAVKSNIEVTAEFVEIPRDHYSLYYIAGTHGSLIGKTAQTVNAGKDGVAVEALPDTGYKFVKWSDDVTDNPRTDKAVSSDIHVEAIFEEAEVVAEYELVYKTDGNGLIEGISTQTVSEGSDGLKVKAVAYRGYEFSQWSDGVTDNPRKDLAVTANVEVTAEFQLLAPKAVDDNFDMKSNGEVKILDVLSNDTDIANGVITVTPAEHGTVEVTSDNKVSYKPESGYEGEDQFSYTVCVGDVCSEAVVSINCTVESDDVPPSNLLSLNNDDINESLEIPSLKERLDHNRTNYLRIFTKSGVVVYEKANYMGDEDRFRGIDKSGTELGTGVYFYVIEIANEKTQKGMFYILRK